MTTGGSRQLREFRIAVRDGASMEDAAERAGISITEANLILEADRADPPPPECYLPIGVGHNSQEKEPMSINVAGDELRLLVERLERLTEEKKGIGDDIKDVFLEAKSRGYDAATMRWALKERAIDRQKRQERDALREAYGAQLGLFD